MDFWAQIMEKVQEAISSDCFETYFSQAYQERVAENQIIVRLPDLYFKELITDQFSEILDEARASLGLEQYSIQFVADPDGASPTVRPTAKEENGLPKVTSVLKLNNSYRFETFVVGSNNEMAHAVARKVAANPFFSYNPVYFYGGVGLGKTHLMHAIGHQLGETFPQLKIAYITSERFTNEMINCIKYDKMLYFREKYRSIDVLLMDDIQFISNKERTQEELFHTFNVLYDNQKQIIISSDCAPIELRNIEDRLRSRFEWGLVADIQMPDFETRVAILKKKADLWHIKLPEDVFHYIGHNLKRNVRELEGALKRLTAYAELRGQKIDLPFAKEILTNITPPEQRVITVAKIQKMVADHFKIKVADLQSKNNARHISFPRHIAMYLVRQHTETSLPKIGAEFGGKDHSTVLHAIKKIDAQKEKDIELRSILHKINQMIG